MPHASLLLAGFPMNSMGLVSFLATVAFSTAGEPDKPSLAQSNFRCPLRDQSTRVMRVDTESERCSCRVRCDKLCAAASNACSSEPSCVGFRRAHGWATLKAAPEWWDSAPGVNKCKQIEEKYATLPSLALRKAWQNRYCDEYTSGVRLTVNRTGKFIFDIGFHSGDDTLFFLERGHDVVAVDANPSMIREGLRRPVMRVAERVGRLRAIATGIVNVSSNQSMKFYVHRRVTQWSTFKIPSAPQQSEFDPINVSVTTCGELIRTHGVPYYMKVDIEGLDEACLQSLDSNHLPIYVSTEDPLQLDRLVALGYQSFKMVSQARARRGQRQFSGGMPEESPGPWVNAAGIRAHPFFSIEHMHVRIDAKGHWSREEHDLHARMASPDIDATDMPKHTNLPTNISLSQHIRQDIQDVSSEPVGTRSDPMQPVRSSQ